MSSPVGRSDVLVVGLGNPGLKFDPTRHNIGFRVADALVAEAAWKEDAAHQSLVARGMVIGVNVRLLKPQTFMNRSGQAVQSYANYHHVPTERLIVVHDDADLPFGDVRAKFDGGTAGHNGLQSIVDRLGTQAFWRVRCGIGRDSNPGIPLDVFVLNPWTEAERALLNEMIAHAVHTVEEIIAGLNT